MRAPGLGPNGVSKFPLPLPSRPALALLEMVTEKVESTRLGGIHNSRLDRMQRQSGLRRPTSHLFQRLLSFALRATQGAHRIYELTDLAEKEDWRYLLAQGGHPDDLDSGGAQERHSVVSQSWKPGPLWTLLTEIHDAY